VSRRLFRLLRAYRYVLRTRRKVEAWGRMFEGGVPKTEPQNERRLRDFEWWCAWRRV
jgi:hypothetical protein